MGVKTIGLVAIIILYLVFGILMYITGSGSSPLDIITGPAVFFWNLVFGFLFKV